MHILVTNDDGVYAPGLKALADAMAMIGEVSVVAPDRNRSGISNALTLDFPVRAQTLPNQYISIEGTPTDCVHLATTGLLERPADIVVSGINAGSNLGDDVFYSGTVAGAIEGRFMGLPSIAVSLLGHDFLHYDTAAMVMKELVLKLVSHPLPRDTILNVNVPDVPLSQLKGFEVTRLGKRHCAEPAVKQIDPRGQPIYWIGLPGPEEDAGAGTDFYALRAGRVSITPIHLDMTCYKSFEIVAQWISHLKV